MNACSRQVQRKLNWSGKIFVARLGLFAGIFLSCLAIAQGDDPSHNSSKSDTQQKPISVFSIKGRPANFTGKRLAAALFQKLTPDEVLLVKNPLARTPSPGGLPGVPLSFDFGGGTPPKPAGEDACATTLSTALTK